MKQVQSHFTTITLGILLLLNGFSFKAIANSFSPGKNDSLINISYIEKWKGYSTSYPFIHYGQNQIEWQNPSAISHFFNQLTKSAEKRVKVLHIGDSHLQADIFTGRLRNKIQEMFGYGGRGMVFPYKAAKTHAAWDYRTFCEGSWIYSRNIFEEESSLDMGISGVTIRTYDSTASFKIVFIKGVNRNEFRTIKLFIKKSPKSFSLKMRSPGSDIPLYIEQDTFGEKPFIEINLSQATDTLEFFMNKTDSSQRFFECYGLQIESINDGGILYNSVGINGAGYKSILHQNLLSQQLPYVNPDLVIIDLGANDFYRMNFKTEELEFNLKKIIGIIKTALPLASIIVTNSQDIYYRKKDIISCQAFSDLTRKVAFESNCAFYDYYHISGGPTSMMKWLKSRLAKKDKVHLTNEGYYLKAELWFNAILNSYTEFIKNPSLNASIADYSKIEKENDSLNTNDGKRGENKKEISNEKIEKETRFYVVKKGDELGKIAKKFHVSVKQVCAWNHLKKKKIHLGQRLSLGVDSKQEVKPTSEAKITKNKMSKGSQESYEVVAGDNLFGIAKKHHITVEELKKINALTSDKLHPGMKLKVK